MFSTMRSVNAEIVDDGINFEYGSDDRAFAATSKS